MHKNCKMLTLSPVAGLGNTTTVGPTGAGVAVGPPVKAAPSVENRIVSVTMTPGATPSEAGPLTSFSGGNYPSIRILPMVELFWPFDWIVTLRM